MLPGRENHSISAMVFMADSERAAELARKRLDGLHLNFSERFTGARIPATLANCHNKIARFLTRNRYSQVLYNFFLRDPFSYSCEAQTEEFMHLFGKAPSHIDGHHHMHLCTNLLLSNLIPIGMKSAVTSLSGPAKRAGRTEPTGRLSITDSLGDTSLQIISSISLSALRRIS
jgi:predicted glycoside hydrolase/deacetylase ChbG (UPF0249 family)